MSRLTGEMTQEEMLSQAVEYDPDGAVLYVVERFGLDAAVQALVGASSLSEVLVALEWYCHDRGTSLEAQLDPQYPQTV